MTHLGDAKILAWEASLEAARLALAPGSPSRLNCLFTCRELKDATTFRDRFRPTSSIYEVAKTDEAAPTHVADYEMITDTGDEPFVDIWVQSALRYWRADDPALAEVLVGGAVSVIQRL